MPDLVTHTAAVYLVGRPFLEKDKRVLLYLGAILPDLLVRPFYILFPRLYFYTLAVHTPVFMAVFLALAIEFFKPGMRKKALEFLALGIFSHFILDLLQKHISSGYFWFFPFSWHSFEIGLFWPHQTLPFIPVWLFSVLIIELIIQMRRRKN